MSSRATPKGKSCQQDYELKGFAAAMPSRLRLLGPIAFSPLPFRSTAMLEPCTCRHDRNFILARLKQMRTAERLERVASEAKHWIRFAMRWNWKSRGGCTALRRHIGNSCSVSTSFSHGAPSSC